MTSEALVESLHAKTTDWKYVNVEVPFVTIRNHRCLTDEAIAEMPELADFVRRWQHCFERCELLQVWIYVEPEGMGT